MMSNTKIEGPVTVLADFMHSLQMYRTRILVFNIIGVHSSPFNYSSFHFISIQLGNSHNFFVPAMTLSRLGTKPSGLL